MRKRRIRIKFVSFFFIVVAAGISAALLFFIVDTDRRTSETDSPEQERNSFSGVKVKTRDSKGREIGLSSESIRENAKDSYVLKNITS
ncbi:MAG: hypothetical protein LBO73_04500, partial [Holosporaceae bacterium]|nr:hypothetical protein [Holosporaceae bacterium]